MKLASAEREIERFGVSNEQAFTIKATGKAFRILSSGLYKNKIRAIIREVSCNALDAHVLVGNGSRPFDVHLPNALEPFFSVRDYGPGLSDADMRSVATKYFESLKTGTNDLIGGLGLGFKSPFSYVDAFTVVSRHLGEKRTYTAYISEDGVPSLSQMGESIPCEPGEENGLEVSLPCEKREDYRLFVREAHRVYAYFPVTPNVTGHSGFSVKKPKVLLDGGDYRLVERAPDESGHTTMHAVMGPVAYPIDAEIFGAVDAYSPYAKTTRHPGVSKIGMSLLNLSIDVDFPIGSLDVTAGREELSYDDATKDVIVRRLKVIEGNIQDLLTREFQFCKSEYEARIKYAQLYEGKLSGFPQEIPVKYKEKLIDSAYAKVDLVKKHAGVEVRTVSNLYQKRLRGVVRTEERFRVLAGPTTHIYLDDVYRSTYARLEMARDDRLISTTSTVILLKGPEGDIAALMEDLDGFPLKKVSDLKAPEARPRTKTSMRRLTKLPLPDGQRTGPYQIRRSDWDPVDVVLEDGGIYVISQFGAVDARLSDLVLEVCRTKLIDLAARPLHVVPSSIVQETVAKHANWQTLTDAVLEAFQSPTMAPTLSLMALRSAYNKIEYRSECRNLISLFRSYAKWHLALASDHPVRRLVEAEEQAQKQSGDVAKILDLLDGKMCLPAPTIDFEAVCEEVFNRYPLLRGMSFSRNYSVATPSSAIQEYIQLIDQKNIAPKS